MTRHSGTATLARLRAVGAAVVFAFATFAVDAAPVALPGPIDTALGPTPAYAGYCASNPTFTGRLTASSASTTAVGRTTSPTVYGYISDVDSTWSCTAYFRYSGIAWNTTATTGTFQWGNLINSSSVACNFVVGSTDYIKANGTADCPDSDAEYALAANLATQGVYQADVNHNGVGDFSFVHADCASYYGSAPLKTGQSFSTGITGNRPEANNCDPITIDTTNTAQTITLDWTDPAIGLVLQTRSYAATTAYSVGFAASDAPAGFDASHVWTLQRQIATVASGVCGTFANDPAAGSLVTGTTSGASQSSAQTLAANKCYRWTLNATDANGNVASQVTSGSHIVDTTAPTTDFTAPNEGTTTTINTGSTSVSWTETETHSGVATRSLQRRVATLTGGTCGGYLNDGSPVTAASPVSVTGLLDGKCYQWIQTLTDAAGNSSAKTSGTVKTEFGSPSANFTTPNEGTTSFVKVTSYSVAWTESAPSPATITSRSLQRQKGAIVTSGTCAAVNWSPDGSPYTGVSPRAENPPLVNGQCYRWVQTLTNSNGKSGVSTSGSVLVDTTPPAGTMAYPEAYRPLAGDVVVTGSATDASSFQDYQLEYGAGASPSSWTTIGTFTSQVAATNPLATWSTGSLSGIYTLRLTVRDLAANTLSVTTRTVYLENGRRGDEAYQSRIPFELGGGWSLDVGVANGEARLARDLFSIPSYGPPQELGLTYSSLETGAAGKFGVGWSSNLTQYLTFDNTSYATDKFIVWHRADGGIVPFGLVGSTWTPLRGHFETLSHAGSETTITLRDQTRLVFEDAGAGRLKRIENRFGKALTIAWNASSATATDASGRVLNLAIDSANNRITGATDAAGRAWSFGYTGTDLTSVTDPASKATTLGYDASHRLTSVTRSRSRVSGGPETIAWGIGYTSGKATSVNDPINPSVANTFAYAAGNTVVGLLKEYAGPVRNTSTYTFDSLGRVTSAIDPEGFVTSSVWDPNDADSDPTDSLLLSQTRPIDHDTSATTTWTYDSRGNPLTETVPIDASTSVTTVMAYNATNDLLIRSESDNDPATKLITRYGYDGSGHLLSVNVNCTTSGTTPPATASSCTGAGTQDASTNLITTYTYTANDRLDTETDPLGHVTKHQYDTHGNETSVIANYVAGQSATADRNVATLTEFDGSTTAGKAGLPTEVTDPVGNATTYTYDALGRQLTEVLPGDASIPALTRTTTYDELGNALTETDAWTGATRTTTRVYDLANRETQVTDAAGVVTSTAYDAAGNAAMTVADGVQTDRTFDGLGRAVTETVEDVGVTTHGFDAAGNEVHTGSADGVDTDRTFSFTGWALSETVDPLGTPLQTVKTYDRLGRESTSTVANGPDPIVTTTTYDRPGRAMTVTVAGAQTTNAYDRAGNRTSVTDPAGIVTTTTYDALDRPTTVVANDVASPSLPSQDVTTSTYYDATGTAVAVRDPAGTTVRTIANARGLGKQIIANCTDSGTTPTPNPPACTGAGTHNATTNVVSSVAFDGSGAATSTVQAVGTGAEATTETAFDAAGRVQAVKDPRGTISRTFYTGDKVAKTVVNCTTSGTTIPADWANCSGAGTQDGSYNLTTTYAYDARGNRVTEVGPNGRVTTSVYDEADRLEKTIANDVASPTLATEDVTTRYFYDDAGRQAAVASPHATGTAWTITRFVFDDAGRVVREIANCTNSGTSLDPDAEDPVACGGPDGTALGTMNAETNVVTDHTYNARGNRTKVVRPSPAATSGTDGTTVTTRFAYDAADRLCRVVENSTQSDPTWDGLSNKCADAIDGSTTTNVSTRYTSDGAGNLATMVDANGNTTTYAYDAAGRMTSLTDALGKAVSWTYNDLGQKTAENNRTDFPTPGSIGWTYDGAGRILTRTANGATTSYEYDATGNRTCAGTGTTCSTAADRITATHDRLNRPLTVASNADAAATTTYTYSLTSPAWADPTGTYLVTLDPFDRATSVDGPAVGAFSTTYRADGQPVSVSAPNGNTTTYAYDGLGRETGRDTNGTGGIDRADYQLAYNRAGQVLSEASTISGDPSNGSTAYAYDPQGRLASYDPPSATATTYGWDEVPNRTSVTPPGGGPVTTSFDAANRPTSDSAGGSYTSDPDGRLTARPGQRLEWDALSRLTKVKPPTGGSTIATYSYDPLDRLRLVDYGGSNRIRFRYVGLTTSVAQVIDDQSGAVIRNVGTGWGGERLLDWTGTNSNLRYYGTNAHHDTTWTGSSTGAVSATLRYDPWGTVSSSTGSSLPDFRFQGSWYDTQTDLSWVVTRWYAPALGRFVSEDSLLGTPADPPSRHLYAYAEGEPVASWDPDGRTAFKSWSIRNYGKYRGSLLLSLFIRAKYNYADYPGGQARMYGDNRSWGPDCKRSRGCISINFTNKTITARVNNTCGDFNLGPSSWFGYGCSSAFSIVPKLPWVCLGYHNICGYNQKVNVISVSEASSGVITIAWDITQSRLPILRPGLTVNGKMIIRPRRCCVYSPSVEYYGEGFPSEELYWYSYPYYQRRTIFQHSEGPWSYMSTGGNWHKTYGFPG